MRRWRSRIRRWARVHLVTAPQRLAAESIERRYAEAMAVRFQGSTEALDLLRGVVEIAPRHAGAHNSLGSYLMELAKPLLAEGRYEDALPLLREAHQHRPEPKYASRLRRTLLVLAQAAAEADDLAGTGRLLSEAAKSFPDDDRLRTLVTVVERLAEWKPVLGPQTVNAVAAMTLSNGRLARLDAVLERLTRPLRIADGLLPLEPGKQTLVVVEAGCEEPVLPLYLAALPGAVVVTQQRLAAAEGTLSHVVALADIGSVGMRADWELCISTDELANRALRVLRQVLPRDATHWQAIDLLEHLSFEVDDIAFRAGRTLTALQQLLETHDVGRVVFLLGDGRLHRACLPLLATAPSPPDIRFVWCSRTLARVEDRSWGLDEHAAQTAHAQQSARQRLRATVKQRIGFVRKTRGQAPATVTVTPAVNLPPRRTPGPVAVLTAPSGQHVGNLVPVLEQLLPDVPVVALALASRPNTKALGLYGPLTERFPDDFTIDERLLAASTVGSAWSYHRRVERALRSASRQLARGGLPLGQADIWPLLEPGILRIVRQGLPEARRFAAGMQEYLDADRPRAVVVSPDRFAKGRLAATLARRADIPTLFPQSVFFSRSPRYKPLQTDYITVMDQWTRKLYVEHFGADERRVLVTGVPRFDALLDHMGTTTTTDDTCRVIVILQRFSIVETTEILTMVASALSDRPDVEIVVKLHPSDQDVRLHAYRQVLTSLVGQRPSRITRDDDLHALLRASSVVVAVFSNVVVEAAMLGKPVLCINTSGEPLPVPLTDEGAAVEATSAAEVDVLLPALLEAGPVLDRARRGQREYFERNSHLLSGSAAPRIAEALRRISSDDETARMNRPSTGSTTSRPSVHQAVQPPSTMTF